MFVATIIRSVRLIVPSALRSAFGSYLVSPRTPPKVDATRITSVRSTVPSRFTSPFAWTISENVVCRDGIEPLVPVTVMVRTSEELLPHGVVLVVETVRVEETMFPSVTLAEGELNVGQLDTEQVLG